MYLKTQIPQEYLLMALNLCYYLLDVVDLTSRFDDDAEFVIGGLLIQNEGILSIM
jgi:hypothetical protein